MNDKKEDWNIENNRGQDEKSNSETGQIGQRKKRTIQRRQIKGQTRSKGTKSEEISRRGRHKNSDEVQNMNKYRDRKRM